MFPRFNLAEIDVYGIVSILRPLNESVRVELFNSGMVSMEKWWISVDIPSACLFGLKSSDSALRSHPRYSKVAREIVKEGLEFVRLSWGDPFFDGDRYILHPGQSLEFGRSTEINNDHDPLPPIDLQFNEEIHRHLARRAPDLSWTLYTNHGQPVSGAVPFDTWCNY